MKFHLTSGCEKKWPKQRRASKMQALQRDPLLENFRSLEEFWTFWDTHSTADYEDLMEDVQVEVKIHPENLDRF